MKYNEAEYIECIEPLVWMFFAKEDLLFDDWYIFEIPVWCAFETVEEVELARNSVNTHTHTLVVLINEKTKKEIILAILAIKGKDSSLSHVMCIDYFHDYRLSGADDTYEFETIKAAIESPYGYFVRYKTLTEIAEIFISNSENTVSTYKHLFTNFIEFYERAKNCEFVSGGVDRIIAKMNDYEAEDFLDDYNNYLQTKLVLEFIQDDGYDISDFYMYERAINNEYSFASKTLDENGLCKAFDVRLDNNKPVAMYIDNSQWTAQNPYNHFVARNIEEAVQKYNDNDSR